MRTGRALAGRGQQSCLESANVIVIADDILPRPDLGGRAAGMRAWGIGQGLEANGLRVFYAVRTRWWPQDQPLPEPKPNEAYWSSPAELGRLLRRMKHGAIVNCSYPSILPAAVEDSLLIQDSHGPRLIEGAFRNRCAAKLAAWRETTAYAKADYFICAGFRQQNYFYPWLALSGFDLTETSRFLVVRFGYSETPPARRPVPKRLIFAGTLLPWTDPRSGWQIAAEEVQRVGGELLFITSAHPGDLASKFLTDALNAFRDSPRCRVMDKLPHEAYLRELSSATAAIDVMQRNSERDLAFPTRTIEYLWAGVPPITYDYGEVGELVFRYNAGWATPPRDEASIRSAVREALDRPGVTESKSKNAQYLHQTLLHPKVTTAPLADVCRKGVKRRERRRVSFPRVRGLLLRQVIAVLRRIEGVA